MVIRIDERWRIEAAPYGFDLIETYATTTKPKDGAPGEPSTSERTFYYSRLDHAVLAILRQGIRATGNDAQSLADALAAQTDRIVAAVEAARPGGAG